MSITEGAPSGYLRPPGLAPLQQAALYLRSIHEPGAYIELRARAPQGFAQSWHRDPYEAAQDALRISHLTDVYVGVLPRRETSGGKDSVLPSRVLWCEADSPHAVESALMHKHPPAMVVCTSPGRAHCYWQLTRPVPADRVAEANRRLAYALGGDMNAVDAARILRVPGTMNHKRKTPKPVFLSRFAASPNIDPGALLDSLPNPPAAAPVTVRPPRPRVTDPTTDRLRKIPSREYAPALAHRDLTGHLMCCPFHKGGAENTPSFHVGGPDAALWFCFGCSEGGDIFGFAARLWGLDEKAAFPRIVKRLGEELR